MAAKACSLHTPALASGEGSESSPNHPTSAHSSGCALQGPADRPEVEHERVEGHLGEAEPKSVEDHDQAHRLDVDARLLEDFLDGDLGGRVADVGPTGRVEPGSRVRPSHEQDLALVVADDGPDRDLRRHVTGDALANVLHPFGDEVVSVA